MYDIPGSSITAAVRYRIALVLRIPRTRRAFVATTRTSGYVQSRSSFAARTFFLVCKCAAKRCHSRAVQMSPPGQAGGNLHREIIYMLVSYQYVLVAQSGIYRIPGIPGYVS